MKFLLRCFDDISTSEAGHLRAMKFQKWRITHDFYGTGTLGEFETVWLPVSPDLRLH